MPRIVLDVVSKGKGRYGLSTASIKKLRELRRKKESDKYFDIELRKGKASFVPVAMVSLPKEYKRRRYVFRGKTDTLEQVFGSRPLTKAETEQKIKAYVKKNKIEKKVTVRSRVSTVSFPSEFVKKSRIRSGKVSFFVAPARKERIVKTRYVQKIAARRASIVSRYVYIPIEDLSIKDGLRKQLTNRIISEMFSYPRGTSEVFATLVFEGYRDDGSHVQLPESSKAYSTEIMRVASGQIISELRKFVKKKIEFIVDFMTGETYEDERLVSMILLRYDIVYQRLLFHRRNV